MFHEKNSCTFANLLIFCNHCDWRSRENQKQNTKRGISCIIHCVNTDVFPKVYFTKIIHTHYGHKKHFVIKYTNIILIKDSTIHFILYIYIFFIDIHTHTHMYWLKALRNPPVKILIKFKWTFSKLIYHCLLSQRTSIFITQYTLGFAVLEILDSENWSNK